MALQNSDLGNSTMRREKLSSRVPSFSVVVGPTFAT